MIDRKDTLMRQLLQHTLFACAAVSALTCAARAQTPQPSTSTRGAGAVRSRAAGESADELADAASLAEVRRQLREQQAEIERLRETVAEQSRLLGELLSRTARVESASSTTQTAGAATVRDAAYVVDGVTATDALARTTDSLARNVGAQQPPGGAAAKNPQTEQQSQQSPEVAQLKKTTEAISRQLGSITFSGDLRLRYEGQFGQLNALPNAENPTIVGNELTARHRARIRARLALRGRIGQEFDWGLRFATGTTPDVVSTNQTLTDFFGRKSFALDQAYLTYRPNAAPGLRLQGGKFETPWVFTEMTWDADITPEGINESYSRDFKDAGALKNLTLVAWQLPLLERNSAFILDSAGRVNVDASRRGGRDLALYGAQARARFELTPKAALTLSAADLYFSGTQFITPAQVFGGQIQVPVTVTISASGTTPARTVTGFAAVPRDFLVSGSALGVTLASTNATNADGRLSSGYNLVDLIGRLELTHKARWPVTLLLNVVTNTQARDVSAPGGVRFENDENLGYWAEFRVGRTRERGDALFSYTHLRIERDAILSPFNFSDIAQSTDIRAHRFIAAYAVDPRVTISVTGIVTQRPNGLLGVFGQTPLGSLNRPTTRLQLDTVFRF
jgi:TolA-binding protein